MANCITPSQRVIDCNNLCNLCNFMKRVLPTAIDEELSELELFNKMVKWAKVAIQFDEQICAEWDSFQTKFDANIEDTVRDILNQWLLDGTLKDIIQNDIFNELNVDSMHKKLSSGGQRIVFIGDSIANGWGWWNNTTEMTDENRGLYSIMKKKYPNNSYEIYAKNSACLSSLISSDNNIQQQLLQISDNPTMCFIICGINDINATFQHRNTNLNNFGLDINLFGTYISEKFDTTINALCSTISYVKSLNVNCDVYYIIPPTSLSNIDFYLKAFNHLIYYAQNYGAKIVDGRSIIKNIKMPYNSSFLYDQIHPNEKGYNDLFNLVIQADFQINQIIHKDDNLVCCSGDLYTRVDMESIINKCVNFVNTNINYFAKNYYNDDLILLLDNEISLIHVDHTYNNNYMITFKFLTMNGVEVKILWHSVNQTAFYINSQYYNTNMSPNTVPDTLDDIVSSGDYLINPSSDKLSDKGFNPAPYVHVQASVCYFRTSTGEYTMQKHFVISQRDCNFILIYNMTKTDQVKESFTKITGSLL